jgi:hypothetical protein
MLVMVIYVEDHELFNLLMSSILVEFDNHVQNDHDFKSMQSIFCTPVKASCSFPL